MSEYPITDTRAIEAFINNGGAVGDAQTAIAKGNKVASAGVSAGMSVAGGLATGSGVFAAGGAVSTALAKAGVASAAIPVIGWVVAGVLAGASGGVLLSSRNRAKILAKDRNLLQKYIDRFKRKSSDWRLREARKQISLIQFLLTKRVGWWNKRRIAVRQARAELKLEALYFIYRDERLPALQQQAQLQALQTISIKNRQALAIWLPVSIGIVATAYLVATKNKKKKVSKRRRK